MNASNSSNAIFTNRFIVKLLNVDDITERYARWLSDETTSKYISDRLNFSKLQ